MPKIETKKIKWSAPPNIHAYYTTRIGGYSKSKYKYSNLSLDVGDTPSNVLKNRSDVKNSLKLPAEPCWMKQIHGLTIREMKAQNSGMICDGSFTSQSGIVCAVLSADCLPILITNISGTFAGVIHVGWRGLEKKLIQKFIKNISNKPNTLIAWIGPSISQKHYPIQEDVYKKLKYISQEIFQKHDNQHWNLDLSLAAQMILKSEGISNIHTEKMCTYGNSNLFYSYRRENNTGRIASLIWIE